MTIEKISVIGTGTMGSGIVQAFAQAGRKVTMKSRSEASNAKAMAKITKSLSKLVEKGKMDQAAMDATLANITLTTDYKDIADSDLIIEAAVEEMHLKIELFKELDALCKKETIIATNTSSLSITGIAANISRPCHVIGMHFFNPATVMKDYQGTEDITGGIRCRIRSLSGDRQDPRGCQRGSRFRCKPHPHPYGERGSGYSGRRSGFPR